MSVEAKSRPARQEGSSSPELYNDVLKNAVKHIAILASRKELQDTSHILDEIDQQKERIAVLEGELAKAQEEHETQEQHTRVTVSKMCTANHHLTAEKTEAQAKITSLETSLAEKDTDLTKSAQLMEGLQSQINQLTSEKTEETAKVTRASREITSLQITIKEKDKLIDKMKGAGSNLKELLVSEKKKNDALEEEKKHLDEEAKKSRTQLQKLESFTIRFSEKNEESMIDAFSALWDYAADELYTILGQNLTLEALNDKEKWNKFRRESENAVRHHAPLLASNSVPAKGMRLAVILGILAREINKHIFQPNYLLSEDCQIRDILSQLASEDSEKESFCRAMLLSIETETQRSSVQSRVQAVVRKVASHLYELLSETQYSELRQVLAKIVERAIEIWIPIQHSKNKYESDFDPHEWGDQECRPFHFPTGNDAHSEIVSEVSVDNLLTVVPRISLLRDNHRYPRTWVIKLIKQERLCALAEQEMYQETTSPTKDKMVSNGARRQSIAKGTTHPNGESFLGKQ
ncbi:uncharacterized protein N7482_004613 [Penicillium canariense]|uniref:Uncharacterized protein n=1 Tax=Penicillium canariense TaxID=189055 RepID=A0A9W9I6M7_9EURO|nr:uncharacterized protein N7482_004613 [Penicillium canariense]KAJ5169019.1 hypothetical protein N7482_004613 [Penicillium canariense]